MGTQSLRSLNVQTTALANMRQNLDSGGSNADLVARRHRSKLITFVIWEGLAVAVTIISVFAGVSANYGDESFTPLFRVVPITAAAAATIIPILFFGTSRRRGPGRHGQRRL